MAENIGISFLPKRFFICTIFVLLCFVVSACSSETPAQINAEQVTISPTDPPDYSAWEQADVGEGKYSRNDFCPLSFSYQDRSVGLLSVAIANHISDAIEVDEIFQTLFQGYEQLHENSLAMFRNQITIFVIPDSNIKNCTSNGTEVFISPESLNDIPLREDIIGASTGVSTHWVKAGLAYLASDEEVDHELLKYWYQETDDLDILGLFIARFMTDWASQEEVNIVRMTAASLITYSLENESIPIESLEESINNDVRNRWLIFLGVERSVDYAYDGFYEPFQFSQSDNCSLILESEVVDFCINKMEETPYFDEVNDAEEFIYHVYTGYQAITDYLLANAPSIRHLTVHERGITVEVKETDQILGEIQGSTIKMHNDVLPFWVLRTIVYSYDWMEKLNIGNGNLLLAEGFAGYLGKLLPIYKQPVKQIIWDDLNGWESSPGISAWFFLDEEQLEAAKAWYLQQGGSLDNEDVINPRLFYDAIAFATLYRDAYGGVLGISIAEKVKKHSFNIDMTEMEGLELSQPQAASYVAWLCDTYSLDTVMSKYVNNDDPTSLEGKDFESLKLEWLAYLKAKGSDISIPDSP